MNREHFVKVVEETVVGQYNFRSSCAIERIDKGFILKARGGKVG